MCLLQTHVVLNYLVIYLTRLSLYNVNIRAKGPDLKAGIYSRILFLLGGFF